MEEDTLNIALVGCVHGELDTIYNTLEALSRETGRAIDLVLCCGDFQSVRDESDLDSVAVPAHHRALHDFPRYHRGERVAPIPTIFVGGNHECSALLTTLPHGGWVAHNIYYLGLSGCIQFGGQRIAGLGVVGCWVMSM
jgi:lariat debranching enzyme